MIAPAAAAALLGVSGFGLGLLLGAAVVSEHRDRRLNRTRREPRPWRGGPLAWGDEAPHCRLVPAPPTAAASSSPRLAAADRPQLRRVP